MNSEKSYKQRTKHFGIPVIGYKDSLWPELELRKYTIIENLLLAATKGATNCVYEEGIMSISVQESGTYSVRLAATGSRCSAMGMAGGAYFRTNNAIEWADLVSGYVYFLYVKSNPKTFLDPTDIRTVASRVRLSESNVVLFGRIDLRGSTVKLDTNPPGKINAFDIISHVSDTENPHGEKMFQDEITVSKKLILQGDIEVEGEQEKAIVPVEEFLSMVKNYSKMKIIDFKSGGPKGATLECGFPVKFASVSRSGSRVDGVTGEVSIEYLGNNIVIFNTGDRGIEMKAVVL